MTDDDKEGYRLEGEFGLLTHLIDVAQKTQGAEVWRALFAELLKSSQKQLASIGRPRAHRVSELGGGGPSAAESA